MKSARASATAKVIAASTLLLESDAATRALVPPGAAGWCRAMLSDGLGDRLLRWSAGCAATRPIWRALERLTLPGIGRHYALRKAWIEQRCRQALSQGVQRVIVVGAGFDTLTLRLCNAFAQVHWIELDHPATQGAKRRALERHGLTLPGNLRFVAADLAAVELDPRWPALVGRDDRPTLFIIEGLLMYLAPERVQALLRDDLRAVAGGPRRVVFSYMARWPTGRAGFRPSSRAIDLWLAWQQEPFRWTFEPRRMATWLHSLGYAVQAHARPPFGAGAGHSGLQGENLVEATAA